MLSVIGGFWLQPFTYEHIASNNDRSQDSTLEPLSGYGGLRATERGIARLCNFTGKWKRGILTEVNIDEVGRG